MDTPVPSDWVARLIASMSAGDNSKLTAAEKKKDETKGIVEL